MSSPEVACETSLPNLITVSVLVFGHKLGNIALTKFAVKCDSYRPCEMCQRAEEVCHEQEFPRPSGRYVLSHSPLSCCFAILVPSNGTNLTPGDDSPVTSLTIASRPTRAKEQHQRPRSCTHLFITHRPLIHITLHILILLPGHLASVCRRRASMMIPTPLPTASARHVPALTALEHQGTRQPNTSPLGLSPYSDEYISVQHRAAGTVQTEASGGIHLLRVLRKRYGFCIGPRWPTLLALLID